MEDATAYRSRVARSLDISVLALAVGFWALAIYYAMTQDMDRVFYGIVFLCSMMVIYVADQLIDAIEEESWLDSVLLVVSGLIATGTLGYVVRNYDLLLRQRVGIVLSYELYIAVAFIGTIIYLSYRAYGATFMVVVLAGILYGLYGNLVPGIVGHGGISPNRMASIMVFDFRGVFGSINQIMATWVSLFLLFAGLFRAYGAFDLILQAAFKVAQYVTSGIAQSAVVASLIIGSITGASTANAAVTGSITIPTMKKSGIKPHTAGGIEAVASVGGQIMPPVMAATAFVMASFLGLTYFEVMVAGILPAAIFYLSVVTAVHYTSVRQLDPDVVLDVENFIDEPLGRTEFMLQSLKFLLPILLLIYLLGIAQWTVMTSALYTCLLMIGLGTGLPLARGVLSGAESFTAALKASIRATVDGFKEGAIMLAPIAIIIGAVNGVLDILTATGVPGIISISLLQLTGGILVVTLLISMFICILLGLGMPTVAAYIMVAALIAPALTGPEFMIPDLAAHYFVFYAAVLSGLTPPIAIAVIVTSGIAEASFWKTAREAISIAAPLFVLPFVFVYNPEIIVGGITASSVVTAGVIFVGSFAVVYGLNAIATFADATPIELVGKVAVVLLGILTMVLPQETFGLVKLAGVICIGLLFAFFSTDLIDRFYASGH